MKTLFIVIGILALLFFVTSCGGAASVGDISNSQSQNQTQDEGQIQNGQEACSYCADKYSKGEDEESLSNCVIRLGFDVSDC